MTQETQFSMNPHRLWAQQLFKEYAYFNRVYKTNLRTPAFAISDLGAKWGSWDPVTRVISISERLIKGHSWYFVLEVLKHEMAHQLVSEHLSVGGKNTTPHGELFQAACQKLRVSAWGRAASGELPDVIPTIFDSALSAEDERLIRKIEKLLALAASTNEHEAGLAMERVREIYARHNLSQLEGQMKREILTHIIDLEMKRVPRYTSFIFTILINHFDVDAVFFSLYQPKTNVFHQAVELIGRRENLLMAEYIYAFLDRKPLELWAEYCKANAHNLAFSQRRSRTSFLHGVMSGFDQKLKKQKITSKVSQELGLDDMRTKALIAISGREVAEHKAYLYPSLTNRSSGSYYYDPSSFNAGRSQGEKLNISRPIESRGGSSGLYLN